LLSLTLARARIEAASVTWELLDNGIGHVKIAFFSQRTGTELVGALRALQEQCAHALALDVRGCTGGLVESQRSSH
jgi:carboxyl-terminal processing protease